MARAGLWRIGAYGFLLVALIHAVPARAQAQSAKDIDALNRQVVQILQQGHYAEALALA
jgi:hypothetical protein